MKQSHSPSLLYPGLIFLALVFGVLGGFWPVVGKLIHQWNNGDNSYCFLIVPLVAYLLWEKRDSFRFRHFSSNITGVILAVLSIGIIFLGELGSVETLLYGGIWAAFVSISIFLYGRRSWFFIFPIFILLFIVPLPPFVNRMLTFQMKLISSQISTMLFRLFDITVLLEGNIIDLGVDQLEVVSACSGLRYLISMLLMTILIGYYFTKGWLRKICLILLVPPILIFFNAIRIFLTGILIVAGHKELTEGAFHDGAGLIIFLLAGVILTIIAKYLQKIGSIDQSPSPDKQDATILSPCNKTTICGTLFLVLFFLGSGYALQDLSKEPTYPQREDFSTFPMEIDGWQGTRHYLSQKILNSLWADDYVNVTFTRPGSANYIYLLIPFYNYQATRHTAHAPQSCLLGGGYSMNESTERVVATTSSDPLKIREMVLQKGEHLMLASYFFYMRGRVITNPWLNKFYLMFDAITKNRTDGALVRVEMAISPGQNIDIARQDLDAFIDQLWQILPNYVPK